jgi:hypothetical protein
MLDLQLQAHGRRLQWAVEWVGCGQLWHYDRIPARLVHPLLSLCQLTLENTGTFWHANGEVLPW